MWTNEEFWRRASGCWPRYKAQDSWFNAWGAGNGDLDILAGLKMYRQVTQGKLPLLLLGDAKIRGDMTLAMNFGFAAGDESDDQAMIDQLNEARQTIARNSSAQAIPVVGRGAILRNRKWSPLVNDAFLLGGAHRGMEFHLALQDFEQFDMELREQRRPFGPVAAQYASRVKTPEHYQQKWKRYLMAKPEVLWNTQQDAPRVFARELVGLKTFGYAPVFNAGGVGFRKVGGGTTDFSSYLAALAEAGYAGGNRPRILSSVSSYLFGDAGALN